MCDAHRKDGQARPPLSFSASIEGTHACGGTPALPPPRMMEPHVFKTQRTNKQEGQAEELAACLLAMPVGSARQEAEALQFLKDFLGDSPVRLFGWVGWLVRPLLCACA